MTPPPFIDARRLVEALSVSDAADALEAALRAGLDPELEAPRQRMVAGDGELLIMPAAAGRYVTVKLVTIGGTPRIQGVCNVFDRRSLTPVAVLDGVALTTLRTPAVSLLAVRRLLAADARRLVVFGAGPQAVAHSKAFQAAFALDEAVLLTRAAGAREVARAVSRADVICCATTAREPLFDGELVADGTVIVAVGSHEPSARELDERLVRRASVVVESRRSALLEAGDLILAGLPGSGMITLSELVAGRPTLDIGPRVFKSTGMSWEDAVVAGAAMDALGLSR